MKNTKNSRLISDMGEFNPKFINDIAIPNSIEELKSLVKYASKNKIKIYPLSTGKNWGLGSKKPSSQAANLISLEKLDKIRDINLKRGYAVIESGVTQKQLHKALKKTKWKANFTHSCSSTSVIGNSLERGVGTLHQRPQDIIGFEIITGKGKVIRSGSMWHKIKSDFYYDHEIGPTIHPLFFQSNFGIVTAAIFKLIPKPETIRLIEIKVTHSKLFKTLESLKKAYKLNLINSIFKIYNANAHSNYGYNNNSNESQKSYIGYGTINGLNTVANAQVLELKKLLDKSTYSYNAYEYDEYGKLNNKNIDRTIQKLNRSVPTKKAVYSLSEKGDLDIHSKIGWVLFAPIVPFDKKSMKKALAIYKSIEQQQEVDINTTFNIISANAIDLVTSIRFDRSCLEERNNIHKILDHLHKSFNELGFYPYRLDIDHQTKQNVYIDKNYVKLLQSIKNIFDPQGIISPGRYGIS